MEVVVASGTVDNAIELVTNAGYASTSLIKRNFKIDYNRAGRIIDLLEERELMDDEFLINANGALLFNSDKTICILINGLDHIKIQVIGYNDIKGLYKIANEIDDTLESHLEYAFDK